MTLPANCRTREITVGQATGNPRQVIVGEEFRECDCPDCESESHWYRVGSWYDNEGDAIEHMNRRLG